MEAPESSQSAAQLPLSTLRQEGWSSPAVPSVPHLEAHSTMPCDSTPLIFWGLRLQSSTTSLSCSCSLGTKCTRPLTTVRGSASPTSIFSTYRLSASGCCQGEQGWEWGGTEGWQTLQAHPKCHHHVGRMLPSPYLFHADHFADADVQPGWDHILGL